MTVVGDVCLVMCRDSTTVVGGEPRPPHVSTRAKANLHHAWIVPEII